MADFLTLNGAPYDVVTTGATERAPRVIGEFVTTFAGTMRSDVRAVKRTWDVTLAPMSRSAFLALAALVGSSASVVCSGSALDGASVPCYVTLGDAPYVDDGR